MLQRLKDQGVTLSIDDFGTGYSSLAYLRRFPVDELKIDRSFIRDMADSTQSRGLVGAIIAMAHSLDLTVVAEGVEDEHQMSALIDLDCTHAQGFYFARPQPAHDLTTLLRRGIRLPSRSPRRA
jgi:FOG: EAL domain